MNILELFAGSRSIGKEAEKLGMEVFSSDIVDFEKINYITDILDFDVKKVPFVPDIIWASPPCTAFSVGRIGYHWEYINEKPTPKTKRAEEGILLVKKTIELIKYFSPKYFYIENPRGMLRKMDFMKQFKRNTVTYCQYGESRMKPTDIFTNNLSWTPKPICKNGDSCHESAPRGSKSGTQGLKNAYEKSKIPEALCLEIIKASLN